MNNSQAMQGRSQRPRSKRMATLALALVATMTVAACQTTGTGTKETIGGVSGAVLGGVLGSHVGRGTGQLIAVGAGAVLGGLVGSSIGRSLDDVDRMKMERTTQKALESSKDDVVSIWVNPNTGNRGSVKPRRTWRTDSGRYCREFEQTIEIDDDEDEDVGIACRQPDGTWRVVSSGDDD